MERKYSLAIKAGFKYGIIIAIIYILLNLVGLWLNTTPAMVSYTDQLNQHNKELFNRTYQANYSYSYPYAYQYNLPKPPLEFYLRMLITLIVWGVLMVGLVATGALVIKNGEQAKYSIKEVLYMGTLGCAGALTALLIGYIISLVINLVVNGSSMATTFSTLGAIPGMSTIFPVIVAVEIVCCCLPAIVIIAAALACIGAFVYAIFAHKLESGASKPSPEKPGA